MKTTEKEARNKWCPFGRIGHVNGAAVNSPAHHDPDLAQDCIGSGCMAWRWEWLPQHRVQQEREALERQRAEEAERIRAEREAEEQRMAIARAEEEARMRAERETQEAELRAQREIQERAAAEERARIAEQARLAAEARAEEERRLQALAQALEQEKAEIAARQRAEREAEESRRHAAEQAQERVREAAPLLFAALNSLWADVEAAQINFPDPPIASEQTIALVEDALACASGD